MKTKRIKYTENMCVLFDKDTKNKIIEIATDANISQGEFVRDAVEHYINFLTTKEEEANEEYYAHIIGAKSNSTKNTELTEFDKAFNTEFFND